eukprot:scaffold37508_cov17-Prasinocladus_malaysianus.AAC.1
MIPKALNVNVCWSGSNEYYADFISFEIPLIACHSLDNEFCNTTHRVVVAAEERVPLLWNTYSYFNSFEIPLIACHSLDNEIRTVTHRVVDDAAGPHRDMHIWVDRTSGGQVTQAHRDGAEAAATIAPARKANHQSKA